MTKVLLIEDDGETAGEIAAELADRGFDVEWSSNGLDGLAKARDLRPDAMIVDRLLPGMDGLTVIESLRKDQVRTPVLVLSALGAVDDRVRGLRMGGDDYLTKPFAVVELVARIEALLRRPPETRETTLRVGQLELDLIERTAKRGEREIDLLPREFRLLEYMMRRSDQLLTRAMLLEEVWNYKFVPATNLVDVHMGRVRHKVDGPGEAPMIHNVRGAGFILRAVSYEDPMAARPASSLAASEAIRAAQDSKHQMQFIRSNTFHWAAALAALFAAFVTILFGFIYFKIDDYLIARSDSMIMTQVNFFAALPPDRRIGALDDHLGQDSRGVHFAGIFDAKGNRLAGNVARLPDDLASRCGGEERADGADRRQGGRRSIGESRRAEP